MKKHLTCIVCPLGCEMTVELDGNTVTVAGNTCPRGKSYAESEVTDPKRTVTSTMRCTDCGLVSVKTDRPIPKDKIMECMLIINSNICSLPVSAGDVIIENVFGSSIIATQNKK